MGGIPFGAGSVVALTLADFKPDEGRRIGRREFVGAVGGPTLIQTVRETSIQDSGAGHQHLRNRERLSWGGGVALLIRGSKFVAAGGKVGSLDGVGIGTMGIGGESESAQGAGTVQVFEQ